MKKALLLALLMFTSVLSGCLNQGGDEEEDSEEEEQREELGDWDVYLVSETVDLPTCDQQTLGRLYYVEMISEFRVCKSTGWVVIDIHGENGENGTNGLDSILDISEENPGENCEFGGLRISSGRDSNSDSSLSPTEITETVYYCDFGIQNNNHLILTKYDSAPDNCNAGGYIERSGYDDGTSSGVAGNGILEDGEIERSLLYCSKYVPEMILGSGIEVQFEFEFSTESHIFFSDDSLGDVPRKLYSLNFESHEVKHLFNYYDLEHGINLNNGTIVSVNFGLEEMLVQIDNNGSSITNLTSIPGQISSIVDFNGSLLFSIQHNSGDVYFYDWSNLHTHRALSEMTSGEIYDFVAYGDYVYLYDNRLNEYFKASDDYFSIYGAESLDIEGPGNKGGIMKFRDGIIFPCDNLYNSNYDSLCYYDTNNEVVGHLESVYQQDDINIGKLLCISGDDALFYLNGDLYATNFTTNGTRLVSGNGGDCVTIDGRAFLNSGIIVYEYHNENSSLQIIAQSPDSWIHRRTISSNQTIFFHGQYRHSDYNALYELNIDTGKYTISHLEGSWNSIPSGLSSSPNGRVFWVELNPEPPFEDAIYWNGGVETTVHIL